MGQYTAIVKDLEKDLSFGLKGSIILTDYLKLYEEGDNHGEPKKSADVV